MVLAPNKAVGQNDQAVEAEAEPEVKSATGS